MAQNRRPESLAETVEALDTLLESAETMVDDLTRDRLFERLERVFSLMPPGDREPILRVLEREVEYRRFTRGTGDLATGFVTRPNPNARLYLRIVTGEQPPPLMDHDELVLANYRGLRVLRYVLGLEIHEVWRAAMAEAAELLESEERAAAREVLGETLAFVESADAAPPKG